MSAGLKNIPFKQDFLHAVVDEAEAMMHRISAQPHDFRKLIVLLPHRRACRALAQKFAEKYGAVILPRIMPLGEPDISEMPSNHHFDLCLQTLSSEHRAWVFSTLFAKARAEAKLLGNPESDLEIALSLGRLIDRLQEFDRTLSDIVPPETLELAEHWQWAAQFIEVVKRFWPDWLAENNYLDPVAARNEKLVRFVDQLTPEQSIILAGSSGRSQAVQRAMQAIQGLPNGLVLLQGSELISSQGLCSHAEKSPVHPSYTQARLFAHLKHCPTEENDPQEVFYRRMVQTAAMQSDVHAQADLTQPACVPENLSAYVLPDHRQELQAMAILVQEKWAENPTAKIAIITEDQVFINRLAAEVIRFGFTLDYGAGRPLDQTTAGRLAALLLEVYRDGWDVVRLLAILKHPLVSLGMDKAPLRALIDQLEAEHLQAFHENTLDYLWAHDLMPPELAPLRDWGRIKAETFLGWLSLWQQHFGYLIGAEEAPRKDLMALKNWWTRLEEMVVGLFDAPIESDTLYREMTLLISLQRVPEAVFAEKVLHILSAMEARLLRFDRVLIPQMVAGQYPPEVPFEPWLTRAHYETLDMPPPEENQGLAMHDWLGLLHQPEVILTRSERMDSAHLMPSMWWKKLEGHFALMGKQLVDTADGARLMAWIEHVHQPAYNPSPGAPVPPIPRPPPQRLRVTDIETVFTNPYDLYVREILSLQPRARRFADIAPMVMGSAVHKVLEEAVKGYNQNGEAITPAGLVQKAEELQQAGQLYDPRYETAIFAQQVVMKVRQIAESWCTTNDSIIFEKQHVELDCSWLVNGLNWRGKVDRLLKVDGGWQIIDYKTGGVPSKKSVTEYYAWQLPLLAVLLRTGSFAEMTDVAPLPIDNVGYWSLTTKGKYRTIFKDQEDFSKLLDEVADQVAHISERITTGQMRYLAYPLAAENVTPRFVYAEQLTRYAEWGHALLFAEDVDAE